MKKIFLILSLGFLVTSCGALFTGTSEQITIDSNVKKATVKFDGVKMGSTPMSTKVKKSFDGIVTVEADGYEEERFQFQKSFNTISILNLTNLFGWAIDLVTGAINKFDMKGYDIELEKEKE
ncbi:PEGA domain-containing protein [Flavobacteriaceae bacterium]|nr:PEGA domain-containing protein [Flavobacteriaceae bacterium]